MISDRIVSIRGTAFVVCLVALFAARSVALAASETIVEDGLSEIAIAGSPLSRHNKVKIELYYMPQCPGCRQLMSTSFSDAFQMPGFSDMADISFIPWGKNHRENTDSDGNFQLQQLHPDQEQRVFDNVMESCALDTIGSHHQELQFHFIECIDRTNTFTIDPSKIDRSCAKVIGLSNAQVREIEECAVSEKGHDLAEQNLERSESAGMGYAPWTVVDQQHSKAIEDLVWTSLFDLVCSIYSGPYRSKSCRTDDSINEQL